MADKKPILDNRVVNMKILIQDVYPGAVRPPKKITDLINQRGL